MDRQGTCEIPPGPRGRQPEPGLRRTKRPRLGRLLHPPGSASASTNPRRAARIPVANQKRPGCGVGSRSAFIVPATAGNRAPRDPSEGREAPGAENRRRDTREGTLSPANLSTNRQRIAHLARARPGVALSSLHHVIDLDWMVAYRLTRKDGAPGIDGVMAADDEANLEANLSDLLERIRSGRYHAPPVRRAYIPKADGTQRPLGIPTFEDKVAQRAVAMVLEAIYEQDFLPCSYGFRPGRSAHQALDALRAACMGCGGASMSTSRAISTRSTTAICGTSSTSESRTASFDG